MEAVTDFHFLGSKITVDGDCIHEIKRCLLPGRKTMTNLDSVLKSKHITLLTKVNIIKAMFLSSSHVWMWELVHKDGWVSKNWCFWTVALNTTLLENLIGSKEIKSVNPKGNQPWIFTGRPVPEAELPVLWPSAVKSQLIGKDPTHWKRPWCWERLKAKEGRAAEDEMVR